jgi:hypothetical protein
VLRLDGRVGTLKTQLLRLPQVRLAGGEDGHFTVRSLTARRGYYRFVQTLWPGTCGIFLSLHRGQTRWSVRDAAAIKLNEFGRMGANAWASMNEIHSL